MQTASVTPIAASDGISTVEAARLLLVQPSTLRFSLCTKGHYFGLRPRKLPNGRLLWPADAVDRLANSEPSAQSA
jgi:hypothetical protein